MALDRTLSISIRDSLSDPDAREPVAQYRLSATGEPLYRVFLYLDGADLPFVMSVTYKLHETFTPPTRTVSRTVGNPRCKFVLWTWGIFTVEAVVTDKTGTQTLLSHRLQYGEQISSGSAKLMKVTE